MARGKRYQPEQAVNLIDEYTRKSLLIGAERRWS
jgi:hypothetical protein